MVRNLFLLCSVLWGSGCSSTGYEDYERDLRDALIDPVAARSDALRAQLQLLAEGRPAAGIRASYAFQLWLAGDAEAAQRFLDEERAAFPEAVRFVEALQSHLQGAPPEGT